MTPNFRQVFATELRLLDLEIATRLPHHWDDLVQVFELCYLSLFNVFTKEDGGG